MNPNPDPEFCRDPFDDLLAALVNGDASARDNTLLNETLRANPAARRSYIRTMAFEAMLAREFAPPEASQTAVPHRSNRWLARFAIAATIMLAATLAWRIVPNPGESIPTADTRIDTDGPFTHAIISSLDDASGRFGDAAITQGMRLTEGLLVLDGGLAEITFDSGAEVTLEGPARLQLESDNKSRLDAGRASAQVPEQARGFVIHTPSSYIRDLGTAFAVEVRDSRETDLHVLDGEVEVSATGSGANQPIKILRQSEAVRLADGNMLPIRFRGENPGAKRRKHTPKIPPSLHWSFDSWDAATTTDTSRGTPLKLLRKNAIASPETIDGPFGLALHFNGQGTFARADEPAGGGSQARTVACWLRLQPDNATTRPGSNGIIAWGAKRASGKWQVAYNLAQGQGTIGAPRIECGDGFVIGATDLRDGRWHHLAVLCFGGSKANVATHVKIYVDGHLEALTGRRQHRIDTETSTITARPITLGRYLGRESCYFEGDLDEVHIFEGALLPGQIARLMKRNSLRTAKP